MDWLLTNKNQVHGDGSGGYVNWNAESQSINVTECAFEIVSCSVYLGMEIHDKGDEEQKIKVRVARGNKNLVD